MKTHRLLQNLAAATEKTQATEKSTIKKKFVPRVNYAKDDSEQFPEIKQYDDEFFSPSWYSRRQSKRPDYIRKHRRIEKVLRHEFIKQQKRTQLDEEEKEREHAESVETVSDTSLYSLENSGNKEHVLGHINLIPYIPSDVKRFKSYVAKLHTTIGSVETLNLPRVPFMDWFHGAFPFSSRRHTNFNTQNPFCRHKHTFG